MEIELGYKTLPRAVSSFSDSSCLKFGSINFTGDEKHSLLISNS